MIVSLNIMKFWVDIIFVCTAAGNFSELVNPYTRIRRYYLEE